MSEAAIVQLISTGGAIAVLVIVGFLILRGQLITKGSHDAELEATRAGATALVAKLTEGKDAVIAEVSRDRDEWKAIAKEAVASTSAAVADVKDLAEALTVRNRIDEDLRRAGVLAKAGSG